MDWFAWGEEAFHEARRRDVPIFLSIGYSTCYWCHVMERECFESEAIAEQLRRGFVSIKLDREERPDLDDLYMAAMLVTRGSGGWPLSIFLEPRALRPFWCGTYLPPVPARGLASFPQVLEGIAEAWRARRSEVEEQAEAIADAVRERLDAPRGPVAIGAGEIGRAIQGLLTMLDRVNGGFGGGQSGPKFPQPVYLEFLLEALPAAADDATRRGIEQALRLTLDKMAQGGMFDQLAGGFHRYSVDATWTVPHFEKMLYDNALLAIVYARASRALDDPWYATIARRTLDYVLEEMAIEEGNVGRAGDAGGTLGFASAQDAEVGGREGANYIWTPKQVRDAISDAGDAAFALTHYGLEQGAGGDARRTPDIGNFVDPHHPPAPGEPAPPTYVLTIGAREDERDARLQRVRAALLRARSLREQPRRDDKQITEWNGMMIAAFAIAARELAEPRYAAVAARAAASLRESARRAGELPRSVRGGRSTHPAVLSDYAWAILASAEAARSLGAVTSSDRPTHPAGSAGSNRGLDSSEIDACLAFASELAERAALLFSEAPSAGPGGGGDSGAGNVAEAVPPRWFDARADANDLFARTLATYDGATPSGASVMLHALVDLASVHPEAPVRERSVNRALDLLAMLSPLIGGAEGDRGDGRGGSGGGGGGNPIATINATRALLRLLLAGGPLARALRDRLPAQSVPSASPSGIASSRPEAFTPVEIFAEVDRVTVTRETPGVFRLFVRIAPGYHIVAAEPQAPTPTIGPTTTPTSLPMSTPTNTPSSSSGDADSRRRPRLMPLRVGLIPGSGSGVRVFADYPPGRAYAAASLPGREQGGETVLVHEGEIEFDVVVERTGEIRGRPILGVTLLACTDTECLTARTYELDIAVDDL